MACYFSVVRVRLESDFLPSIILHLQDERGLEGSVTWWSVERTSHLHIDDNSTSPIKGLIEENIDWLIYDERDGRSFSLNLVKLPKALTVAGTLSLARLFSNVKTHHASQRCWLMVVIELNPFAAYAAFSRRKVLAGLQEEIVKTRQAKSVAALGKNRSNH